MLDPALQKLDGKINEYSADFTEFAVAWVISNRANHANFVENQYYADSANFDNFTTEYTEPWEISAKCMNFA